jgi:Transposase IS200 like
MTQQHHLNHATWDCKYHVVFIPKYRKKSVFGKIKKDLGAVFHDLAPRRECRIEEGHLMPDHVHPGLDPAETLGCRGDRLHQGQKLDLDRAEHRAEGEELHRAQILGARVFRLDGGPRRGDDPRLHQEPGASGSPNGSTCADTIVPSQK